MEARSFAHNASQQLRSIASELCKERGIKAFCSLLQSGMVVVAQHLEEFDPNLGQVEGHLEHQLLKVLDKLERLSRWPIRSSNMQSSRTGNAFDRKRYPTLARLETKRYEVKKAIRDCARASDAYAGKFRQTLIQDLKWFSEQEKGLDDLELSESKLVGERQQQDDYQAYIRALYAGLATRCLCQRDENHNGIIVNLRLRSCCTPGKLADSVNFRLFFLDHPHNHDADDPCEWQDTQICVLRKRNIKLAMEPENNNNAHLSRMISMETFCEIISNRQKSQLKLAVSDDGLVFLGSDGLSKGFLLDTSSISLADLLDELKHSLKKKLLLSFLLAKAVWQFYDSNWMQKEWTKNTVHFMFAYEQRSDTPKGIFINEPFLSARFDDRHLSQSVDKEFRAHQFPKILALGIMLLEIELGMKIESRRKPEYLGLDGKLTVNTDHFVAAELFNDDELWSKKDTFPGFKDIIGACLTPDDFMPYLNDVQGLRDALEKCVVDPLQDLYKKAWVENPETSYVPPIKFDFPIQSLPQVTEEDVRSTLPLPALPPAQPTQSGTPVAQMSYYSPTPHSAAWAHTPSYYNSMQLPIFPSSTPLPDGTMSSSSSFSSDDWFQQLDQLNLVLRPKPKEKDSIYQPVKIAILDTGVSEEYDDLVTDYKDFITQDEDEWQDKTGHGTIAVKLIKKLYHMAEIYVGRVFDGSQATDNTAALMAKAIRHAREKWKVDIMILSSGFKAENRELEDAIDEARSARILIFAAASNYGNIINIAFPGRLYKDLKLFCMFSTNPDNRALPSFNPSGLLGARHNFAILGENIILQDHKEPLKGTSYATMIGGAIAGRILDFSRQKHNREKIRSIHKLQTVEGMSTVFAKMAAAAVDNGYHCMAPWKILPLGDSELENEDPTAKRLRERDYICETISRCLEEMHRI